MFYKKKLISIFLNFSIEYQQSIKMSWGMILAPFRAVCSVVTYTAITIINTVGNLTSPVFNWGSPERKFSINFAGHLSQPTTNI